METTKQYLIKSGLLFAVLIAYVLVVTTHIFYLPRLIVHSQHSSNSIVKRKNENLSTVNSLGRIEKAIFKVSSETPCSISYSYTVPFKYGEWDFKKNPSKLLLPTHSSYNFRYSYLTCCVFRI